MRRIINLIIISLIGLTILADDNYPVFLAILILALAVTNIKTK